MKRILINATQTEELRVAIVDINAQNLLDLLVERQSYVTKTGNIYMGKITAIEPSLDACFVNFGSERHGFLPFKEIIPNYLGDTAKPRADDTAKPRAGDTAKPRAGDTLKPRASIKESLKEGQKVMIQVEKEERGNKGAALTTFISLAGSYLVLMPNNPKAGGISRRVEGGDRDELREILSNLPIPDEMGLIVRTAGVGKAISELQWDLNTLLKQWEAIQKAAIDRNPPFLIHQESDIVIRAIRDHLREDVSEIWVDDPAVYARIKEHLEQIRPDFVARLKLYSSTIPLFTRYQIEHQIEAAHQREVRLPSGGSIVIGHTEALVAIDVNSGQATKGKDIEQTAFEINKEAARVVACQLRLRDIGGLVVIDFIDMPSVRHRREVENELRNALKLDKARTQVGTISSRFGLLEMSRQRLRHSLGEATRSICAKCDGWGSIRSVESLSLSILRVIEEDAIRPGTTEIHAQLPIELATFIINEKRNSIAMIEKSQNVHILIIPNAKLESPHYRIKRLTANESGSVSKSPSYRLIDQEEPETLYKKGMPSKAAEEKPAVQSLFAGSPTTLKKPASSLVKRLIGSLFGSVAEEPKKPAAAQVKLNPVVKSAPASHFQRGENRSQRNQERTHRPQTGQPRRPRNAPPASGEKPQRPQANNAPNAPTAPQPTRPRRNTPHTPHGANQDTAAPNKRPPVPAIQPVKAEPLTPPNYPQPALSDVDLETYYQESAAFANKKSSQSIAPTKKIEAPLTTPAVVVAPVPVTPLPVTPPLAAAPIIPSATEKKEVQLDKYWTPHKIIPAQPSTPAVAAPAPIATPTPAPVLHVPVKEVEKPAVSTPSATLDPKQAVDSDKS
jgi:ribonuclease E